MQETNRYFLESWFRGDDAALFRSTTGEPHTEPHPHITFVRPFTIPDGNEEALKLKIIDYCRGIKPIKFLLEGKGSFGEIEFVPVISQELQNFDSGLENLLEGEVDFEEKLNDTKILHVKLEKDVDYFPRTESAMLRLVCLKNRRILFSIDFVTGEVMNREDSLDIEGWKRTLQLFYS